MDAGHGEGPEDDGHRRIDGTPRAREPAAARPDTRVVSVRGREGDLRDLLSGADLTVPASGGAGARRERTARPGLRAAEVTRVSGRATDAEPLSVPADPATGTGPPEDDGEPPHRPLPTTERPAEGEADAVFAATGAFPEADIDPLHTMPEPRRPPGRGEAAGRSGARHPDICHRPGAPRRPASGPAAAGDEKGPAGPWEAEPGHPGPRRPRKAETGMG